MKLSAIDLNLLLVLHTVLSEGSVARAATKLHVTPPAVSNALARLRDLLGDPLLVRRGRGLVPTPRAVELAPRLASALRELELAIDENAAFDPRTTRRRFVLACPDAHHLVTVPRIAAELARVMPHAQLHVVSIDQLAASDGLSAGTVDAAVAPVGVDMHDLHAQHLYTDEPVLVVREGHPMGSRLTRAQFNALRHIDVWLLFGRPGIGNQLAEDYMRRHGLVRQIAVIVPGFAAAAAIAAHSDLAAGMPRQVAEKLAEQLPIKLHRLPAPPMRIDVQLVWHTRTHHDPGAIAFREIVANAYSERTQKRRKAEDQATRSQARSRNV